eukprot:g2427.t1
MKEPRDMTNKVAMSIDQDLAQDPTEGINSKRLRQRVATELKRRRSSIVASFRYFVPEQPSKSDILNVLAVPIFLKGLLERAASLSATEVEEEITSALAEDFARRIIGPMDHNDEDDSDTFPAIVIGALIKHLRKEKESERGKGNMARTLIAAFFEICDEVSDIVLAILFAVDAKDLQWAAILMFVFMGLNRCMCFLFSITFKEPFWRRFEALLGVKAITDTYRLVTQGASASAGSINMVTMRTFVLGTGLGLESFPQMMLQLTIVMSEMKGGTMNQGILVAQIASVLASCLSIGLSFGSLSIDQIRSLKLKHPSGCTWLPSNDGFREMVLFICLVVWSSLHILLVTCGLSALYAFADTSVSLPTLFGHCFVFNVIRYIYQNVGWRALSFYSIKSATMALVTYPIFLILVPTLASAVPAMSARYQCILGPILFTYAIASSVIISVVSLIVYVPDVSMKILFGILAIAYLITVVIFLANIDENIFTFLFSTVNWKETLRDELWDSADHSSKYWGIPDLVGNHDARHAAHIARNLLERRYKAIKNNEVDSQYNRDVVLICESSPVYSLGRGATLQHVPFFKGNPDILKYDPNLPFRNTSSSAKTTTTFVANEKNRDNSHPTALDSHPTALDSHSTALDSHPPLYRVERGGEVTYHGPGQIVAYPIFDLRKEPFRKDLHWVLRQLEEVIILTLRKVGVSSENLGRYNEFDSVLQMQTTKNKSVTNRTDNGKQKYSLTGVWVGDRKVAAIGLAASRWLTYHGIAINVDRECLANFKPIVPCGIDEDSTGKSVTCVADLLAEETNNLGKRGECKSSSLMEVVRKSLQESFVEVFYGGQRSAMDVRYVNIAPARDKAHVIIQCVNGRALNIQPSLNLPGVIQKNHTRQVRVDALQSMADAYLPGDIIVGFVLSTGGSDGRYQISTAEKHFGVLHGFTDEGRPLQPLSATVMQDPVSYAKAKRKVALPY